MQRRFRRFRPCSKITKGSLCLAGGTLLALFLGSPDPVQAVVPTLSQRQQPVEEVVVDLDFQAELSQRPVWKQFLEQHGDWSILWDQETGRPSRAVSQAYPLLPPFSTQEAAVEATRSFMTQNVDLFGFEGIDTELDYAVATDQHQIIVFRQQRHGIPIEGSQITFFVDHDGRLPHFNMRGTMDLLPQNPRAVVPSVVARDILLSATMSVIQETGASLVHDEPELVFIEDPVTSAARLTWKVGVMLYGEPYHFVAFIDSETGEIVRGSNEVYHVNVEGHVDGRALADQAFSNITTQPMPQLRVSVQGGNSANTDVNGDFVISHGGSNPVTVSVGVFGRWVQVDNLAGGEISDSAVLTPGVPGTIVLNPTSSAEFDVAQVNAFLQVTKVHNYFKSVLPNATRVDRRTTATVNRNSNCNAFYNGITNYYSSGGGCNNTAFRSIVAHELGHEYDDLYGGIVNGGISEGNGDILSMYMQGDPIIGPGFFQGSGQGIRNGSNSRTFPGDECGGGSHCEGEIWMGFAWRIRARLVNQLGASVGADEAEQAVFPTFISNPGDQPQAIFEVFLNDDDDGNLSNGTPNVDILADVAELKGFDAPIAPVLTATVPSVVGRCGGEPITIDGRYFRRGLGSNNVRIGGVLANVTEVQGTTALVVDVPSIAPGTYDITVTTIYGTGTLSNAITLDNAPEVTASRIRIGRTPTITVCGTPNCDYFLVASLRTGSAMYEGVQIGLGPRVVTIANSFSGPDAPLDGNGDAAIQISVPNNSNLIFQTPRFQAGCFTGGAFELSDVYSQTIFP